MKIFSQVKLLRPLQWLKNLILVFPPFLGGVLFSSESIQKAILPLAAFCMASSATYIFNDICDREQDCLHPVKKTRPIANGRIKPKVAALYALFLLVVSFLAANQVSTSFFCWLLGYLGLSFAYSLILKHHPIIDIFCISGGFVLRLFAGGAAFGVEISDWLFLSVLFLSIFLSAGKRLGEMNALGEDSATHRKSLANYPPGVLEGMMYIPGAAVMVTYAMYAISEHRLMYTVPLCCFGLFRYLLLVKCGKSGDPTDSLLKDPILFLVGFIWAIMVAVSTYTT